MHLEATTLLPTGLGTFMVKVYRNGQGQEVTAICSGAVEKGVGLPVRVHSACFTAEALASLKCDCKQQLDYALAYIARHQGVVLYLPQEGRGIGLSNKIRAYALQEQGYDTIEANLLLNLPVDGRSYEDVRDILQDLDVQSICLLTNNPAKLQNLADLGVKVAGRIPVPGAPTRHSARYLETKRQKMGHLIPPVARPGGTLKLVSNSALKRPYVHVNFAIDSLSRSISTSATPVVLSCDADWQRVHELREKYSCVAVGANTWMLDSPRLTARANILGREPARQPARVIFSGGHDCRFVADNDPRLTIVIGKAKHTGCAETGQPPIAAARAYIETSDHQLSLPLNELARLGIASMLVEGGLQLIGSFIQQRMVDLLTIYVRTDSVAAAIKAAVTAIPDLAADQIAARALGQGILLSLPFPPAVAVADDASYRSAL